MSTLRSVPVFVVLCLGCMELMPVSIRANSGTTSVPIRMAGSLVIVPVAVEDAGVYSFLLDTGTGTTVIDAGLADELRLPDVGGTTLMTTGGSASARVVTARLGFGGIATESIGVLATSLDAMRVVDPNVRGVLGQDILRRSNWQLDYRRGVVEQDLQGAAARKATACRCGGRPGGRRSKAGSTSASR